MKKPLEIGHINVLSQEICEYIECYKASDWEKIKQYINYNLKVLEDDAKRALQKALSISEPLLQYISTSDVAYHSNLGIDKDDENYLLSTSICDALYIILVLKSYHYLDNIRSEEDRNSFDRMIKELRDKIIIYRGIELEYGQEYSEVLRSVSKKATDAKYNVSRALKSKAASIAKQLWENGSPLMHHEMKKYLAEEYQDENGKHPFVLMPEKALLTVVKQVAKEIGRVDLISGHKKSK